MIRLRKTIASFLSIALLLSTLPSEAVSRNFSAAALKTAPGITPFAMPVVAGPGETFTPLLAPGLAGSGLPTLSNLDLTQRIRYTALDVSEAANDNMAVAFPKTQTITATAHGLGFSPKKKVPQRQVIRKPFGQSHNRKERRERRKRQGVAQQALREFAGVTGLPAALMASKLNKIFDKNRADAAQTPLVSGNYLSGGLRHDDLQPALPAGEGIYGPDLEQDEKPSRPAKPEFQRPRGLNSNYFIGRALLAPLVNLFFGPRIRGLENLPKTGPALLLPNHVTWVDVFLLAFAAKRPVRFLMYKDYYENPKMNWFVKRFAPIPIEPGNPSQVDRALAEARDAISNGDLVAIFPEGTLTRNGTLRRFKRGLESISADLDAPVIPVHFDGLWTSLLSRKPINSWGDFFQRIFKRSIVRFGKPLHRSTVAVARDAVEQLSAISMRERVQMKFKTLGREFVSSSYRYWFRPAFADSTGVSLTYGKALTGSWLLSRRINEIVGSAGSVGILMPATVGGALANASIALLGKTSVNINFTASREAIGHAIAAAGLRHVVTSRKFLDGFEAKKGWRLESVLEGVEVVILEDLAKTIPGWKKTLTYIGLLLGAPFVLSGNAFAHWWTGSDLRRVATVIFTSGSTAMPKGVPLSDLNILSNIEMIRDVYPLGKGDVVMGVLPFFHSFGYTVTLWMSVMMGVKTVYHPDPFDADTIGKLAQEHNATTILGTPTFLRRYRERIPAEFFDKMKLVIAGAEKLWARDIESFENEYGTRPMEGYGATETAPVVSVSIPDWTMAKGARQKHQGYGYRENSVGVPLPGISVRIVDPETGEFLPADRHGMILVRGPNVMEGYLNDPEKTAEVLKNGWYHTGDIGYRDRDGFLYIVGRASRFAKIAGEMVPLGAVEEKLHKALGVEGWSFSVFAVPDKKMGERLVVLHTGFEGSPEDLLAKVEGLPRLWTPRAKMFFEVDEFPILGTGKADLKSLQKIATELGGDSLE